ncbi:GlsB/YeaQ/YmgE family stress response membrane protein [Kitasatospora sp. CM 4170]|uniref:GlsB/YeaQ/YmgE family stress response membrane protein n=1 Tax=Kitasatospora aburaviensis TaxID=67265 RepID=A0ABW1ENC2_9ACTN|nr:GlsB/YeaQ/YmgE family stress response membrane protein [Kitasatospora sp. CM 4170]WNM48524.1 GlsB/YeaQ/YmgE family stress response membrane protein [Kitasatospora sp. CM 4170]
MSFVAWIVLGLVAGALAKLLLPGKDPGGLVVTTLIGIAGSFVGGWISSRFLHREVTAHFFDLATWASAIGGALVLLIAYRLVFGNSRR